jgi:tripartite-type tricarboxylate transporter receptor subunit TctC
MSKLIRAAAIAALALCTSAAAAQDYPTKPVRILVPYPPGGASDVTARVLADKLTKRWGGKAVFVENKAGANGVIGTETIARADPDGHTLGLVASSHVANPALFKTLPFKLDEMTPVT